MSAKIFITDYASYNDGSQFEFGHWIDLSNYTGADDLQEYITAHFKKCDQIRFLGSPREELMITDFEGFPKSFYSESGMDFSKLYDYLEAVAECTLSAELVEQYADHSGYDITEATAKAVEAYCGEFDNDQDFAYHTAESDGSLRDDLNWPYNCIDWRQAAYELMMNHFSVGRHYFRSL